MGFFTVSLFDKKFLFVMSQILSQNERKISGLMAAIKLSFFAENWLLPNFSELFFLPNKPKEAKHGSADEKMPITQSMKEANPTNPRSIDVRSSRTKPGPTATHNKAIEQKGKHKGKKIKN